MAMLSSEDIDLLFPGKLGHKVIFKRNRDVWVKDMHPNLDKNEEQSEVSVGDLDSILTVIEPQDILFMNDVGLDVEATPCTSKDSSTSIAVHIPPSSKTSSLKILLEESLEGKHILTKSAECLDDNARGKLCKIISLYILKEYAEKPVTSDVYAHWVHEIRNLFTKENPSVYFYRALKNGSKGLMYRVQGKLPDMIHNIRKKYQAAKVIDAVNKNSKRSRSSSTKSPGSSSTTTPPSPTKSKRLRLAGRRLSNQINLTPDANIDCTESLDFLKNSSYPWTKVEEKWVETHSERMKDIRSSEETIYETLKRYPALSNPKGYSLLVTDYELAYPKYIDGLHDNFLLLKPAIIKLAEKKNKDTQMQALLELNKNSTEETSNVACLFLLPQLLTAGLIKGSKGVYKPSKQEVRDSFLCHVTSETELTTTLHLRRKKVSDLGLTLQPQIFIVGQSLDDITSYFVIIDQVKYRLCNVLAAVDTCFKVMWALNAQYPIEAQNVWYLLQVGCYKLKTEFDSVSTSVKSVMAQLGIEEET